MRKHGWIDAKSIKYLKTDNKTQSALKTLLDLGYLDGSYLIIISKKNIYWFF